MRTPACAPGSPVHNAPDPAALPDAAADLMPVVECLKLDGMDTVQQCMDNISPWMEITEDGELNFSLNAVNGFIGGSVGALGTVISTMIKKNQVKDRLKCGYCEGTGQILCGHCLGSGMLSTVVDGKLTAIECANCEGTGTVVCINCQGSGLSVPDEFLQVLGDDEVGFTEEDYIGLFDETPRAPAGNDFTMPAPKAPESKAPEPVSAGSAPSEKTRDPDMRPEDFTGGLG